MMKRWLHLSEMGQCEGCLRHFTKDNHMDKKSGKGKAWMGKDMCWKGVATSEIKDPSEDLLVR
jgi:hypothetical protein